MAKTYAEWLAEAAAKGAGGMYTGLVPMAKVKLLDPGERQRHGDFKHLRLDTALDGEQRGLWEVVEAFGASREGG